MRLVSSKKKGFVWGSWWAFETTQPTHQLHINPSLSAISHLDPPRCPKHGASNISPCTHIRHDSRLHDFTALPPALYLSLSDPAIGPNVLRRDVLRSCFVFLLGSNFLSCSRARTIGPSRFQDTAALFLNPAPALPSNPRLRRHIP